MFPKLNEINNGLKIILGFYAQHIFKYLLTNSSKILKIKQTNDSRTTKN